MKLTFLILMACALCAQDPALRVLGSFRAGQYNAGAAEIVAHDPRTHKLFVVNGADRTIDVLDASAPASVRRVAQIAISAEHGRAANSVAVRDGVVAVAVEADPKTDPGSVLFYDTNGTLLKAVKAGALPDMITFSPDGKKVLVANEGEPSDNYQVDPEGTVTIVDISNGLAQATVKTVDFRAFTRANLPPWVRVFGANNPTPAQDFEPEYIAVSPDSKTAWVTLQENNAIAVIDVDTATVKKVVGLGVKEHWRQQNTIDASDRDGGFSPRTWTVWGMYQPDAIAAYTAEDGKVYLLTANEGDAREWGDFIEPARVATLRLDPRNYPNEAELKLPTELGRLNVTSKSGDEDGDGDIDFLFSFGARSFSIWSADVVQTFDSGNHLEIISYYNSPVFNPSNTDNTFDSRSDDKGPEPESVVVGTVRGKQYAFIGNERQGNIVIYELTSPGNPRFIGSFANRNFGVATNTAEAGDLGPEGLAFVTAENSPTGKPLLLVANEISGTTTIWQVD